MGKEHKGLAYAFEKMMGYFVQHNRQGNGKHGSKNEDKTMKVEGVSDNRGGGVALKEEFKVGEPVKGAAEDTQPVVETLKGQDDIGVRTVAVNKRVQRRRK
jgi:hypothetical protein